MPPLTLLVLGVAVLSGVAAVIVDRAEPWPDDVPSRASYDRIWESDPRLRQSQTRERYLAGVLRFYSGSFWDRGWGRRQSALLDVVGRERAADLELLGRLISSEWAKPEPIRRITPEALTIWERRLGEARDPEGAGPVLDRIRTDVRALLEGSLPPSSITPARYELPALTKEIH